MPSETFASPTLLGFLWDNRRKFAPGLAYAIGRIIAVAPFPIIFKHIIDRDMPDKNMGGILAMSGLMVALLCAHQWLIVQGGTRLGRAVSHLILRLRARLFDKVQYLSFGYLDRQKSGHLLAKYAFDTQKIDGVAMPILNSFVPDSVYSLLTMAILMTMDWRLCFIVALMLPIIAVMRWRYFASLRRKHEANRLAQEQLTGTASEFFGALRLVRSFGEEKRAKAILHESNREATRSRLDLLGTSLGFASFGFGAVKFLSLLVVAGGAILSIQGGLSAGTVLAFVSALPNLVSPIQMFTQLSDQYLGGQEAYNSIRELLDEPDTEPWQGTKTLDYLQGRVEFDHVSFAYPGSEKGALHDFSLHLEPGEKVALVGPSGAGKSTIASLMLGLYAPNGGEIRIDGVPQAELDMRALRRHAAVVMQDSVLLSGTVEDNIRFAREGATDQEVRQAARMAQAEEFIDKMPDGYRTVVGEKGVMLSGGQRQRISIARALLRDPALLILDEPTSALDTQSEQLIQEALTTLAEGRTVLTIAHRLSTILGADRVIVLDEGRVAEAGTFDELWQRDGRFRIMLQAQGIALDGVAPALAAA